MRNLLRHILLLAAAAGFASTASAALLTDLLVPGASLQQGDKIFENFTWAGTSGPAGFTISGLGDGSAGNLYGIAIGGPFTQAGAGSSDWQLTYSVRIAPGDPRFISDIHQYVNVGSFDVNTIAHVSEDVLNAPNGVTVAHSLVGKQFTTVDAQDPPAEFFDNLILSTPLKQVWVKKDILLSAEEGTAISATIIEQRFSQVPEPTTILAGALLLLPFGLSSLRYLKRNA